VGQALDLGHVAVARGGGDFDEALAQTFAGVADQLREHVRSHGTLKFVQHGLLYHRFGLPRRGGLLVCA
jgi:hypothetical protein